MIYNLLIAVISNISIILSGLWMPLYGLPQDKGDYPVRPLAEVHYTSLEVQLEAGFTDRTIRGSAHYNFRPKHAHVESMSWLAPGMDILELRINGQETAYRVENDSLFIPFEVHPDPGQSYSITISYETRPTFGVHFRHTGTIFSSTLPGSVAHWLPGPIHPGVSLPVTIRMDIPEGQTAAATGSLDRREDTDNGNRYTYATGSMVPISELFFAVGNFSVEESFSGTKNLRVYHENGALEDELAREILSYMVLRTRDYERYFRSELPVPAFHAVILADDMWETRPYAAGGAVFSSSEENIKAWLSRSLAAQWFGISLRPERWIDSRHITLLQALVAEENDDPEWDPSPDPLEEAFRVPESLYSQQGMDQWQWSRHFLREKASPVMLNALQSLMSEFAGMNGVHDADDFTGRLYNKTGRWMEPPNVTKPEPEPGYRYRVIVAEPRGSDRLSFIFIPLEDQADKTFNANVYRIRDGEIHEKAVTFHGAGDTLEVAFGGHSSNVWIEAADDSGVQFESDKPFSFWLYQMRRDERPEKRREAALALKDHASDPDLQLAVQDMLSQEQNTEVLTAMYRLMAELTSGASGTERRFFEGIASRHPEIRLVSMQALKSYRGNTQVENQVLSVIQESDDIPLVNEAIRTYRHLIEEDAFRDFAIQFLREDRQEQLFTKMLLEELFNVRVVEQSVSTAAEYLNQGYSFDIRWLAFRQLGRHAQGGEWQVDFVKNFSGDPDPRIRFITLFSVSQLDLQDQGPFLESRMLVEYDIRILKQASKLASTE